MAKAITSKGKVWELFNSAWMLWAIVTLGFFNYISFFYIGYKVKQKKWTVAGIIYVIPFAGYMFLYDLFEEDSLMANLFLGLIIVSWIVSIIHVTKIRAEYLLRLEQYKLKSTANIELENLRNNIQNEYNNTPTIITSPKAENKKEIADNTADKENEIKLIDINTENEETIASVPSLGIILAKKVVKVRAEQGGFHSLDDFSDKLQLKPHIRERIKPYVTFSSINNSNNPIKREEKAGRIVDF